MCGGEKREEKIIKICVDEEKRDKEKNKIKNRKLKLRNATTNFYNKS